MLKFGINKSALLYPAIMLTLMWGFFFLQSLGLFQNCWGAIIPLTPEGLKGVLFSPLLHSNLEHLFGNSVPMAALMFLLFQFYKPIAPKIFLVGWLFVGLLVWAMPPFDVFTGDYHYVCIIGASGIVYVLAFFLFFSGVFRWNMKLLTISLIVALYYGSLIWGVFPEELFYNLNEPSRISWQSHLSGAVVGIFLAFVYRKKTRKKDVLFGSIRIIITKKTINFGKSTSKPILKIFRNFLKKRKKIFGNIWKNCADVNKMCIFIFLKYSGVRRNTLFHSA